MEIEIAEETIRLGQLLKFANLVADGFSMGASNFLARRSYAEASERADGVADVSTLLTLDALLGARDALMAPRGTPP